MSERVRQFECVGEGARSVVYRGKLSGVRGVARPVAIKRLKPALRTNPDAVDLFAQEARICVSLEHPNIMRSIEFSEDDEGHYLLCEWLEGADLACVHKETGTLNASEVAWIAQQIGGALDYLHRHGNPGPVFHGDVTPSNIFLLENGTAKLMDFGVARCQNHRSQVRLKSFGTEPFAAPEQQHGQCDGRSDVFGFAATLKYVCHETVEAQLSQVWEKALNEDPDLRYENIQNLTQDILSTLDPSPSGESVAKRVEKVVTKPSAKKIDGAVQSLLGSTPSPIEKSVTPVAPKRKNDAQKFLGIAAGLLVILGLSTFLLLQPEEKEQLAVQQVKAPAPSSLTPPPPPPVLEPTKTKGQTSVISNHKPAEKRRPKPVQELGHVQVNAIPWAAIEWDGKARGNTPLREFQAPVGRHRVRLTRPGKNKPFEFDVVVTPNKQTFLFDLRSGTVKKRISP